MQLVWGRYAVGLGAPNGWFGGAKLWGAEKRAKSLAGSEILFIFAGEKYLIV